MSTIQFAWQYNFNHIDLIINGNEIPQNIILLNENGEKIRYTIKEALRDEFFHLIIETEKEMKPQENIYFLHRQKRFYLYPTIQFLNDNYTSNKPLGSFITNKYLHFNLWSPTATSVKLLLFTPKQYQYLYQYELQQDQQGVWSIKLPLQNIPLSSVHLMGYQYVVTSRGYSNYVIDPYSKSLSPIQDGREIPYSIVIDPDQLDLPTEGEKLNQELLSTPLSFIGYEAHIRDFTISPSSPVSPQHKGTFLGFSELVPYFKEIGVSHIQLMPVQKFQTVNELQRSYQDQNTPPDNINYNWGYDPLHYFSLEGWYSTDPHNPLSRIEEFAKLVNSFHQENIGIILDVVYNHIFDQRRLEFVAPGCYLRRNRWGDVSYGTGAGASIESRIKMTRRLIIDSLCYLVKTFKVNGFRFDLMSFLDHQTLIEIRHALGEDIILYGEAWNFTDLPFEQAITKNNYPLGINLGIFNDASRDAFIGHMDHWGMVQGNFNENLKAKSAILGGIKDYPHDYNNDGRDDVILGHDPYNYFAHEPINTMNFLDIHDGFTLWDKINLTVAGSKEKKKRLMRRALSLLFSSQGRIVLHGGVELMRSKPMASNDPTPYRAHSSTYLLPENRDQSFHENSYCSADWTNAIRWENLNKQSTIFRHVQKLIELRKKYRSTRLETKSLIHNNVRFIEKAPPRSSHSYTRFQNLPFLTIKFIHGIPDSSYFLVGEIFPTNNANPRENPYQINFDQNGNAEITFSPQQLQQFDTAQWGFDNDLQIKLVKTAGEWDYPTEFYSPMGYNLISLYTLTEDLTVSIDLAYRDYHSILSFVDEPSLLAYTLRCKEESLIIIHNLSNKCRELKITTRQSQELSLFNLIKQQEVTAPFKINSYSSKIYRSSINIHQLFLEILKEEPCSLF